MILKSSGISYPQLSISQMCFLIATDICKNAKPMIYHNETAGVCVTCWKPLFYLLFLSRNPLNSLSQQALMNIMNHVRQHVLFSIGVFQLLTMCPAYLAVCWICLGPSECWGNLYTTWQLPWLGCSRVRFKNEISVGTVPSTFAQTKMISSPGFAEFDIWNSLWKHKCLKTKESLLKKQS